MGEFGEDDCQHPMLSESHGDHGHYCHECGGEFPFPDECYECALEATSEQLKRVIVQRHDLRKALARACTALENVGRDCKTWRGLLDRTDPDRDQ